MDPVLSSPLLVPAFSVPPEAVVEYVLEKMSAKRALESLYSGACVFSIDDAAGTAVVKLGTVDVGMPVSLLSDPRPPVRRPISKADTVALGRAVCSFVGWVVCMDFLWVNRGLPVFSSIYETAVDEVSGRCWVLSHALQILQRHVHEVAVCSFRKLLVDGGGSAIKLEQRLEALGSAVWALSTEDAAALFRATAPFELRPAVRSSAASASAPPVTGHLLISDQVAVAYPLRDWCFLSILCMAHAAVIWPGGVPIPVGSSN